MSGETGLLVGILLETFRVSDPPKRAPALGRDPVYLRQTWVVVLSQMSLTIPSFQE